MVRLSCLSTSKYKIPKEDLIRTKERRKTRHGCGKNDRSQDARSQPIISHTRFWIFLKISRYIRGAPEQV